MTVDAGKAIRLVATFVVGIVIAVGAAMIYSVARHARQQPNLRSEQKQAPKQTIAPTSTSDQEVTEGRSVLAAPKSLPDQPSEAYVQAPQRTVVRTAAPGNRSPMPPVHAPSFPSKPATPPGTLNSAPNFAVPPPSINPPLNGQATAVQPWTAEQAESSPPEKGRPTPRVVPAAVPQAHTVTLWSGTPLTVKLTEPLSTDHTKEGQYFRATLAAPITRDGFVIAEAGSALTGKVIASKRGGMFGRAPDLRLILVDLQTTDNQIVRIQTTSWDGRGQGHNPLSGTVRSAVGAVSGALTGAARGSGLIPEDTGTPFTDSRNVVLPGNAILQFRLATPLSLTEHTR
jgi:hypothetical protein